MRFFFFFMNVWGGHQFSKMQVSTKSGRGAWSWAGLGALSYSYTDRKARADNPCISNNLPCGMD